MAAARSAVNRAFMSDTPPIVLDDLFSCCRLPVETGMLRPCPAPSVPGFCRQEPAVIRKARATLADAAGGRGRSRRSAGVPLISWRKAAAAGQAADGA